VLARRGHLRVPRARRDDPGALPRREGAQPRAHQPRTDLDVGQGRHRPQPGTVVAGGRVLNLNHSVGGVLLVRCGASRAPLGSQAMPTADDDTIGTLHDDVGGGHVPQRKIVAATVGAAVGTLIAWCLSLAGLDVPTGVEGAITVLATFAIG